MAVGEIFYVAPSEGFAEGNPYTAAVLPLDDYQSVVARITPPFYANHEALTMLCDRVEPIFHVKYGKVLSTISATTVSFFFTSFEKPDGSEITTAECRTTYEKLIRSLINDLGATESIRLFKEFKG